MQQQSRQHEDPDFDSPMCPTLSAHHAPCRARNWPEKWGVTHLQMRVRADRYRDHEPMKAAIVIVVAVSGPIR